MGYEIPADHHTSAPDSIRESRKGVRKLREYKIGQKYELEDAIARLKLALESAKSADCPQLTKKIRSAIKSAEGAMRHIERRFQHTKALNDAADGLQ